MQTILYRTWSAVNQRRALLFAAVTITMIVLMAIGLDKGGCAPPPPYRGG